MATNDKIKAILNNKKVGECFFNLYDRWIDECRYEDINEYGAVIFEVINKRFSDYGITLLASTKRPFGVKISMDDRTFHIFIKLKGCYAVVCAKAC